MKAFSDSYKSYQFGYNDAMQIALDNERKLQATITELQAEIHATSIDRDEIRRQYIAEAKLTDALQAEVNRYRDAIKKWLDGDYPNPRRNRSHDCPHGIHYWQECENCETEYWQSVIEPTEKDDE
jgi:hypothetical protein